MSDINITVLAGNITKDCQLKKSKSGRLSCMGTIAVSESVKDANGNWTDEPSYILFAIYGDDKAMKANDLLKKGTGVTLSGSLKQSRWQGKDGSQQSMVYVKVKQYRVDRPAKTAAPPAPAKPDQGNPALEQFDDEPIPF